MMTTGGSHGSMMTTGDSHGSMMSTDGSHGPMMSTDGSHGPTMTTDSSHGPMMSTDGSHGPMMTTDGSHGPMKSTTMGMGGGHGDICDECIEIFGDDMYMGKYEKMEGESKCPTSCDYMKLNDSKERVWCFKPGMYDFKKFESKCPMGTGSNPTDMSSPMMSSPMMSSHMMSTHGPHGAMTTGMGMGGHGGRFRSVRDILQNNKFHG